MSKTWGISSPSNRGFKKPFFDDFATQRHISSLYLRKETWCSKLRCKLQGVSYIISTRRELWSTNGLKLDRSFYPPSVNSAFHFIAKLRRRRPANRTQPNFAAWGCLSRKKLRAKKRLHLFVFSATSRRNGEYLLKEGNQARALESTKGILRCPKISWTLVNKRLKTGPEFLLTVDILYRPQSIAHAVSSVNVAPHSDSKWNGCSSDLKPQKMLSWKCYRIGRPWMAIHRCNCHLF